MGILLFSIALIGYNLLLFILFCFSFPISFLFLLNPRTKDYFYRFRNLHKSNITLVHGASVGEHSGTLPLAAFFLSPVFTANTSTGVSRISSAGLKGDYLPWDLPCLALLTALKYRKFYYTESELNPNLIFFAYLLGRQQIIYNLRFSQGNMKFYKLFQAFYKILLSFCSKVFVKDEAEQVNAASLRINARILKNTKYYGLKYRGGQNRDIILFASTHKEDETRIAPIISELPNDYAVIIAPRHIDRINEVMDIFRRYEPQIYSPSAELKAGQVYIVDTMGRLNGLYPRSAATFIGGTYNASVGGHNPIEPVIYGSPVFTGPHYENFIIETRTMKQYGVISIVSEPLLWISDIPESGYISVIDALVPASEEVIASLF